MGFALRFSLFFTSLFLSLNCFAWNALGHMVIATIAYDHLKPEIRAKVDTIIANFAREYPEKNSITQISVWPDEIRGDNIDLYTRWHYIDNAFSTDGTPIKNISDTDNILWALPKLESALKNPKLNPYEQARFLAFLVHLSADIHQPLHTTSRISAEHPDGDAGGNLFALEPVTSPDLAPKNLHMLWDSGCNLFSGEVTDKKIAALERSITTQYPEEYFGKKTTDLSAADWVQEGFDVTTTDVYNTPENQLPSDAYLSVGKDISEQKAALAGYRLANLLNKLLV